jgi:hypothetical protein
MPLQRPGYFIVLCFDRLHPAQYPFCKKSHLQQQTRNWSFASTALWTRRSVGFPFVSVVVNIPQRAQAVNELSPVRAGLALLPLLLTSPLATAVQGVLTSITKVPPLYLIVIGATLQLIGVGLTSSLPTDINRIVPQQYGYEAIMGLGFGLGLSTVLTLAPLVVSEADLREQIRDGS